MAKLVSFVICDAINNIPGPADQGKNVPALVAPQIVLRPQFIPGNFSFALAVGVADIDLQAENKIRITISDPTGNFIQDLGENELPKIPIEDTMPKEYQGFMINMDVRNFVIESEGEYTFSLYINGECIGMQKIPVFKRAQ